ncbi:unnamed protein product [Musa acuminata subsp. burmannicoides]
MEDLIVAPINIGDAIYFVAKGKLVMKRNIFYSYILINKQQKQNNIPSSHLH